MPALDAGDCVIGTAGALTGYGGGIERKRWLLELEAAVSARRLAEDPAALVR
jgi:hypothetical protein